MDATRIVSIVVPTFNRLERLRRCIDKIRRNVSHAHEVIVVDGGSTDGTREWLRTCGGNGTVEPSRDREGAGSKAGPLPHGRGSECPFTPTRGRQGDLRVILEAKREGAVAAFNKGFRAAGGYYVMWLNDDAYPLPGSVEAAVAMIERPDLTDVGMVAFYHNWHSERNVLDRVEHDGVSHELCHVRGYPYANFGLIRRELLERIGYADDRFYFFGFDPDLSLKVQIHEGLKVLGCRRALIHHDEHHDERKLSDLAAGREDNARLFAKWNLPDRDAYPDPAPAYRKMVQERGL